MLCCGVLTGWYSSIGVDGSVLSGCFYGEKRLEGEDKGNEALPSSFVYVRGTASSEGNANKEAAATTAAAANAAAGVGTTPRESAAFDYFLSEDFVNAHNSDEHKSWIASANSSFIQQHRSILPSLIKYFGHSKVNSTGEEIQTRKIKNLRCMCTPQLASVSFLFLLSCFVSFHFIQHFNFSPLNKEFFNLIIYLFILLYFVYSYIYLIIYLFVYLFADGTEAFPSFLQGASGSSNSTSSTAQLYACPCKEGNNNNNNSNNN